MKYIQKNQQPPAFAVYRKTASASYEDLVNNHHDIYEEVRLSLAEEQGFICCYCGQRITGFAGTQIEHTFPKKTKAYETMQLDYESNLIASCDGGKYNRKQNSTIPAGDLHCDTSKADDPIPINPLNPLCEEKFLYDTNGTVLGVDPASEVTVSLLNLNSPILVNQRKYAIAAYSIYPVADWKQEYERLNKKNGKGEFEEFCFVLQSYISVYHPFT